MPNIEDLNKLNQRINELEKQQETHDSIILFSEALVNSITGNLNLLKQSNASLLRENAWLKNKLSEQ